MFNSVLSYALQALGLFDVVDFPNLGMLSRPNLDSVTVYKVHRPIQHGLSRIMTTAKTTAGTIPYAGTGTVPREVVPDW